ncbi:hypothetical protein GOODEAATRI_032739 [Goodea atripinnis]|uniref:Uncharacterized protein n=1 Tax=Goodea atripinnis TaxID=208336 RepID=A0ABV0NZY3_9TELE
MPRLNCLWDVHVPVLVQSLHLGGPAILGQVFLVGGLGVGVGHILLPCLPGSGWGLVLGIGDWALCWLCPKVRGWLGMLVMCPPLCGIFWLRWASWSALFSVVGPHSWSMLRTPPAGSSGGGRGVQGGDQV